MADKYQTLEGGKAKLREATVVSTGVAEAGDLVGLGTDGKLDASVLPVGVGPDVAVLEASEDLGAGDYVNIFDDAGTAKVRLADNSNGREAHGWVKSAALTGVNATVYFEGPNDAAPTGVTGQRAYLGTAGGVLTTPLDETDPAQNGKLHQLLGAYVGTSVINTDIDDCVIL